MARTGNRVSGADDFYETTRMYHRYRIPGLRNFESYDVVESLHQPPIPFPEDGSAAFLSTLGEISSWTEEERKRRVLEAAYYDYETLHSRLERIGPVLGAEY